MATIPFRSRFRRPFPGFDAFVVVAAVEPPVFEPSHLLQLERQYCCAYDSHWELLKDPVFTQPKN